MTEASAVTALRVVRAARAAFAAHGYGGASMRTIAAEVGVTAMALYNYVPSKAALLQLVFDQTMTEVYGSLSEAVAGRESMVGEVHAILERSGEILQQDPDLLHFRRLLGACRPKSPALAAIAKVMGRFNRGKA